MSNIPEELEKYNLLNVIRRMWQFPPISGETFREWLEAQPETGTQGAEFLEEEIQWMEQFVNDPLEY